MIAIKKISSDGSVAFDVHKSAVKSHVEPDGLGGLLNVLYDSKGRIVASYIAGLVLSITDMTDVGVDFSYAKGMAQAIRNKTKEASVALSQFPKGTMGLTPDHVKASSEFHTATSAFNLAFQNERCFNSWYTKTFKKELQKDRALRLILA